MKFKVYFLNSAEDDLFEIYKYVFLNDSEDKAEKLFSKLKEICLSLESNPQRGHIPKELIEFGTDDLLEIIHKPYRIIYRIIGKKIFIHCILDGRRELQKLLYERLVRR